MTTSTTDDAFNPEIQDEELPPKWKVESRYDSSVYLQSPEDEVEHVILQRWGDEGYLIEPMVAADDVSGATAKNDPAHAETFENLGNAIDYAIAQAKRLA